MRAWLENLEQRERLLVIGGAAVLFMLIIYLAVFAPLYEKHEQLQVSVAAQHDTLQWMQQGAQRVSQLQRGAGGNLKSLDGSSLLSVSDSTARSAGLGPQLKRIEPEGKSSVRVWLEGASFDAMIGWLAGLNKRYGIDINSISIDRSPLAGQVDARITLQAP